MRRFIVICSTLALATAAYAGPTFVCPLVCQRARPVISDGILGTEVDRCRCAQEPAPTPIPTPQSTPNTCVGKMLPVLGDPANGEFGYFGVQIADGATHSYCHAIPAGRVAIDFDVFDKTGSAQCFWASNVAVTPPLPLRPETSFGGNAHLGYWLSGNPIPAGTYRISVTARTDSGCAQKYGLSARSR